MLENYSQETELKFKDLSPEEKAQRGILGRLYGPVASIVKATRNGRKYTESLWEKVFNNPITKEMFSNGGVPGELDHPVDREETDSSKIAIMMPEAPSKAKDGKLMGYFDIIDTPCGRIAYALAKYGFNLGISSRGTGEVYMDENGEETVDEDSYNFTAFDLVLLPASETARLKLAEGLDMDKANFKKALRESFDRSSEEDKKIMTKALEDLHIDLEDDKPEKEGEINKQVADDEADDDGAEIVASLQESLRENQRLQKQVMELQEKLSVGYAKEIRLEGEITKLKVAVKKLSESASREAAMRKKLETVESQLEEERVERARQEKLSESYRARFREATKNSGSLNESLHDKDKQIVDLRKTVKTLQESVNTMKQSQDDLTAHYEDTISGLKQEHKAQSSNFQAKIDKSSALVEKYKTIASSAVDKYIESKAVTIGVTPQEVKGRLGKSYSFNDIDRICESLCSYKRNMSKLPISFGDTSSIKKIGVTEDKSVRQFTNPDDEIDESLMSLINN